MDEFKADFSDAHGLYLSVNKASQLFENLSDTQMAGRKPVRGRVKAHCRPERGLPHSERQFPIRSADFPASGHDKNRPMGLSDNSLTKDTEGNEGEK
jgi:hypothetical protein